MEKEFIDNNISSLLLNLCNLKQEEQHEMLILISTGMEEAETDNIHIAEALDLLTASIENLFQKQTEQAEALIEKSGKKFSAKLLKTASNFLWEYFINSCSPFPQQSFAEALKRVNKVFLKLNRIIDKRIVLYDLEDLARSLKKIKQSEVKLENLSFLVNSSTEAIISLNQDGNIISWNSAAEKLYDVKSADTIGKNLSEVLKDQKLEQFNRHLSILRERMIPEQYEAIRIKDDGHQVKVLNNIFPIKDASGQVIGSGVISKDITAQKEAEEKLAETKQLIEQIAEATPNILYVYNPIVKKIVYINKAVKDVLGYNPEYILKLRPKDIRNLIHEDDRVSLPSWIQMFNREEKITESECKFMNSEGKWRWMNKREKVFRSSTNGKALLILGIAQDITEQKRAQEKLRKSKLLLLEAQELASLGNWEWDLGTEELTCSDELYKMLGFDPRQMVISFDNVKEKVDKEYISILNDQTKKVLLEGIPVAFEQKLSRMNGEERYLFVKAKPVFNKEKEVIRIHGIAQDITDRRKAEEEIRKANEELQRTKEELININNVLEARVLERTEELKKQNEMLEKINADLDNFVYTASHDLKAPISNIEGLLYSLDVQTEPGNEDIRYIIGLMRVSITRFKETIKDLTEISKIQKNFHEDESPVNFNEFLEDIKFTLIEMILGSETIIHSDFSACSEISFSRKNFKSILYNLVSNAIKYRHPGRKPEISISTEIRDNFAVLTVKDNGLGFKSKDKVKIFGMFKRLHDHVEGTGVGLYIVKRIVENAGGRIEVESEQGQGSTFKVYFKLNQI